MLEEPCLTPRLVEALRERRVLAVACGSRHTLALVAGEGGCDRLRASLLDAAA